jgi:predicted metalloprotease
VGTGLNSGEAHGSYFDRVSAFQQGFDDGPTACRDAFGQDRPYTQGEFQTDQELQTNGNASYPDTQELIGLTLPEFWGAAVQDIAGTAFTPPTIEPFSRDAPDCDEGTGNTDLVFCADDNTVGYDETDLTQPLYDDVGDYAVLTAVAIPYALAVRDQLGLSSDDQDAVESAVCQAGAYTAAALNGKIPDIVISPGDADESVSFLLEYATDPEVLPDVDLTGFQLVDKFRSGVFEGLPACDIGA